MNPRARVPAGLVRKTASGAASIEQREIVDKCQGPMARRIYVAAKAQQQGVVYLTGVGHGSYPAYMGHYYDPIFEGGNYTSAEATGKIVHFLSCETARDLGPDFVKNGCLAYFGYDEDFVFTTGDQDILFRMRL